MHELLKKHDHLANKRPPGDGVTITTKGTDAPPATDSAHCKDVKFNCWQEDAGCVADEWQPGADTMGVFTACASTASCTWMVLWP